MKRPSLSQAKLIMRCWSSDLRPPVLPSEPNGTLSACIKRGWLAPTDETYQFPNGQVGVRHSVTPDGLLAASECVRVIARS